MKAAERAEPRARLLRGLAALHVVFLGLLSWIVLAGKGGPGAMAYGLLLLAVIVGLLSRRRLLVLLPAAALLLAALYFLAVTAVFSVTTLPWAAFAWLLAGLSLLLLLEAATILVAAFSRGAFDS